MPQMRRKGLPPAQEGMRVLWLRKDFQAKRLQHSQAPERVMAEFEVILLTESGDFLLEKEKHLHRENKGVEAQSPHVITEDEKAHRIEAREVFIPYSSLQNIQYGKFEQETVE